MDRIAKSASMAAFALLTAVLLTAQVQAQGQKGPGQPVPPSQGFQGPIGQTPWFGNKDVRQQLKFSDDHFNRLNNAYGESWSRYQQGVNELGKTLTPDQRSQRMQELQQNFYKSHSTATNEIITDPQMRARYNQLNLQYRGYDAFNDPAVQQKLSLTAEQRQKLGQYNQEWQKSMGQMHRDYATDREGVTKRFGEMRQQDQDRMDKLFTEQQRTTWRELTGDPYNFQPNFYFQAPTAKPGQ